MSQNPPQTLSVKRKRHDAPVDALMLERLSVKRQKSQNLDERPKASLGGNFYFRRLTKPNDTPHPSLEPPTPTGERRFHLEPAVGKKPRVFVEARPGAQKADESANRRPVEPAATITPESNPQPRKRPGAGSALRPAANPATQQKPQTPEPTEEDVRELEAFSKQVEKEDNLLIPLPLASKHKPKAPAQRFADRHPEKAAALAEEDGDAMDIDADEYVYDTYVRETIMPDADGKLPEPAGTVGFLVIGEEDEDWWNGENESDREFDTDDEDENAEDYYANDYPEDELDEDDEFNRDAYQKKNRRGSDDEDYNMDDDDDELVGSGEDEDDLHFKMTVPKAQRAGYWGAIGE
jgi:hypothetical protein